MEAAPLLVAAPSSGVLLVTQDFPPDRGRDPDVLPRDRAAPGQRRRSGARAVPHARAAEPAPAPPQLAAAPGHRDPAARRDADNIDRWRIHGSFLFAPMVPLMGAYLRRHPEIRTIVYAQWQSALWHLFRPDAGGASTGGCAWCTGAS